MNHTSQVTLCNLEPAAKGSQQKLQFAAHAVHLRTSESVAANYGIFQNLLKAQVSVI
jgi:hypothetical protein